MEAVLISLCILGIIGIIIHKATKMKCDDCIETFNPDCRGCINCGEDHGYKNWKQK